MYRVSIRIFILFYRIVKNIESGKKLYVVVISRKKERKMKRRLGSECLGFLAYGLGLELLLRS